jgi:DNA-binding MarR family transcriptional regulator
MVSRYSDLDLGALESSLQLLFLSDRVEQSLSQVAAAKGLSSSGFVTLLILLDSKEEVRPSNLANLIGLTRGTITSLLNNLEIRGMISRHSSSETADRRCRTVQLTEQGKALLCQSLCSEFSQFLSLIASLTPEDRLALDRLSQLMKNHLNSAK